MSFDVVVIGGGPAGLATAVALARVGSSVLVCERAAVPGLKPCGEGLLPRALQELGSLGLSHSQLLSEGKLLHGVRYVSASGMRASAPFREGPGLGLRRTALARLLRDLAERTPGVSVHHGDAHLRLEASGVCRVLFDGQLFTPRLVIGADGLTSRTRKAARLQTRRPSPLRYGVRQHFKVEPWTDQVEVHWSPHGEAYVTPTGDNELNVAFLWQGAETHRGGGSGLVAHLLRGFPELAHRLGKATAADAACARGPLHVQVPTPARDGLLLVGDAAGYVDAITGEGVGLAISKASTMASLLRPALARTGPQVTLVELGRCLSAARKADRRHVALTRLLLWLRSSPWAMERLIAALADDTRLFSYFLSANQGLVSPWGAPLASSFGLLRHLAQWPATDAGRKELPG
ncbi:MAG TPA: NAD(P)/FAD-dependent oxidoreductase [Polyangiaceae bacterium]|nr:NAD(P)/FAD-dependent oxidoreductase [Polyangiaceae bacterium]